MFLRSNEVNIIKVFFKLSENKQKILYGSIYVLVSGLNTPFTNVYADHYKGVRAAEDRNGGKKMKLHISCLGLVLENTYYFIIIDSKYYIG